MIEVNGLSKVFKLNRKQMTKNNTKVNKKVAVNNITFKAEKGEIFGLLGPNGAGKTTTLRCISTLIAPTEGTINVLGNSVASNPREVRSNLAFLTNELKLDEHFTPEYTMSYFGKLHGMADIEIESRMTELFNYFGVNAFRKRKISELSTGMKQKLSIAVSIVHDPDVVIFDEPTNGLDIITARAVTDYLQALRNRGKIVIVSTHIMSVAEKLCDNIAIILDGEIKVGGTLSHILEVTKAQDLEDAFFNIYSESKEGQIHEK